MHKALLLFVTASCLYAGGQPALPYRKKIPSLQAYAAIQIAALRFPDEVLETVLPAPSQSWVDAACQIITNFYSNQHNANLGTIDCPDMAHFVILYGKLTPNEALASAEKNKLRATSKELRDRGALYQAPILRDYRWPNVNLAFGNGELV